MPGVMLRLCVLGSQVYFSHFQSNSPLMCLLCRVQMIQTRLETTAVKFLVLPVTFYSFTPSKSEAKDN